MLNLATETDIERLRQAALLLEQENARLFRRLETLVTELREARGEDARSLQLEIAHLKEQLASRTKALFGDSSERRTGSGSKANEPKDLEGGKAIHRLIRRLNQLGCEVEIKQAA